MVEIKVIAFKESGKYGYENICELDEEFVGMAPWDLRDLIAANDESVRHLSCVASGFGGEYFYIVEVLESPDYVWPLEGGQEVPNSKMCYFHMDRVHDTPKKPKPYVHLVQPSDIQHSIS